MYNGRRSTSQFAIHGEKMMSAENAKPAAAAPPHVGILQILGGVHIAGAISCLAQLGIPDLVEHGPKSAEELAKQIGVQPRELYRLMRATASVGVLAEGADGKFSETPLSSALRSNANPSLRSFAIMSGREWHGMGWSRLEHCVRTGKQALEEIYGEPVFKYLEKRPEEGKIFNETMSEMSAIEAPAVADAYNFSGIGSIVDVAGGHGQLLATIMERNPQMKGTLYDMPYVVEGAKELNIVFERQSAFASVPRDGVRFT